MKSRKRRNFNYQTLESRKMFAVASGDFNGDGVEDMAYGVPGEDTSAPLAWVSQTDAGTVNVIYGSDSYTGLTTTDNEVLTQGYKRSPFDEFGSSLAAGDFNNDGFDDLAVGIPKEDVNGVTDAGGVAIFYGSKEGLRSDSGWQSIFSSPELWHQGNLKGGLEANDQFGSTLSVGDFDNDGYDDLAVGTPNEDLGYLGSKKDAGAVNVIYGSSGGLSSAGNQLWHQDSYGINGVAESGDSFGSALSTGDFNNDGRDDLAVGVPNENVGNLVNAGAVNVLYGRNSAGLSYINDQIWTQNSYVDGAVEDYAESHDNFGSALASGDFDNDGRDDLAIGVPGESFAGKKYNAGAVNVLYGRSDQAGLTALIDQFWHQDSYGIQGGSEAYDNFGASLAAGDFDNNGYDDLAIGAPGEDVYNTGWLSARNGSVNVIYGKPNFIFAGLSSSGNQIWHQNSYSIVDHSEVFEGFGTDLAIGDFNGDGRDDLSIYVPGERVGAITSPAAHVIYGRSNTSGLTGWGDQLWHQNSSDAFGQIGGTVESSDNFWAPVPQ